ncbi:hypothetical protein DL765_002729 [Monosporascus sp. GIB2]|nr:hypothetical protein DL765_002729 [Monosporascus sp. GIB2]
MDIESKRKIERSIWSTTDNPGNESNPRLESYFGYCHREMRQAAVLAGNRVEWFNSILSAFDVLKSNHDKPKRDLGSPSLDLSVMDLGLRLMLMTGCRAPGTVGGDVFRPRWKDHESLVQYIGRVYPRSDAPPDGRGGQLLSLHKLGADYLKSCANVDIRWTDHLTDHLLLLKGSDWKTLYVFAHPAFIFQSLQTLVDAGSKRGTEQSDKIDAEALSRSGCLPPSLLHETLLTLEILFPPVGDARSQRLLAKEVTKHALDPMLLQSLQFQPSDHESPSDARKPTDIHGLYQRFPFWAARLHDLWAEADDPVPVSYIGKFTEKKKSPSSWVQLEEPHRRRQH